jgi:membrane protease YdiL (CAAX protease family)
MSSLPAILITGLAFGLGHGLVVGLPVLAFFGITLAWLRWQTGSVCPGMVVHSCFNGLALLVVVFK